MCSHCGQGLHYGMAWRSKPGRIFSSAADRARRWTRCWQGHWRTPLSTPRPGHDICDPQARLTCLSSTSKCCCRAPVPAVAGSSEQPLPGVGPYWILAVRAGRRSGPCSSKRLELPASAAVMSTNRHHRAAPPAGQVQGVQTGAPRSEQEPARRSAWNFDLGYFMIATESDVARDNRRADFRDHGAAFWTTLPFGELHRRGARRGEEPDRLYGG